MSHSIFKGDVAAVVTPMNRYGDLDFDASGRLPEWMIGKGTDAVVVNGTTGESTTLDDKEKMAITRYTVRQVDGRTSVIAGTGSNCTERAMELSRRAQELGTDALLQMTPYYSKASQEGPARHFTQVADRMSISILLYNVSSHTRVAMQSETYRILSEHPNIRGTKETSGNLSLIARTTALRGQGFDICPGSDDQTVPIISLGDRSVVSVLTSIVPKETYKMCRLYLDGDVKESRRIQFQLLEIVEALSWNVSPIPVKTTLGLTGVRGDDLHFPLTSMEPKQRERLAEVMKRQRISLKRELYNQTSLL